MTIQEKIEQEANRPDLTRTNNYEKGFQQGANFILNLLRWRDVNEEFPKVKEDLYQILIKKKENKDGIIFNYDIINEDSIDTLKELGLLWRYIDINDIEF